MKVEARGVEQAQAALAVATEEHAALVKKHDQEAEKLKAREGALAAAQERAERASVERKRALLAAADGDATAAKQAERLRPDLLAARLAAEDEEAVLVSLRERVATLSTQVAIAQRVVQRAEFNVRTARMVKVATHWDATIEALVGATTELVDLTGEAEQFVMELQVHHLVDPITRVQRILGRAINNAAGRVPMLAREVPSATAPGARSVRGTLAEMLQRDFLDIPSTTRTLERAVIDGPYAATHVVDVEGQASEGAEGEDDGAAA